MIMFVGLHYLFCIIMSVLRSNVIGAYFVVYSNQVVIII